MPIEGFAPLAVEPDEPPTRWRRWVLRAAGVLDRGAEALRRLAWR
jgi:hypothetical protein